MTYNGRKDDFHERQLQVAVHEILSNPAIVWQTVSGKRLQILSPGRHNVHPGPDFIDVAILLDGIVVVGDAEFHRKSSEWKDHHHGNDPKYSRVILHIVSEDNTTLDDVQFETLILDKMDVATKLEEQKKDIDKPAELDSIEELQHWALLRLLRKTAEAQKEINENDFDEALRHVVRKYLVSYYNKSRRPVYQGEQLKNILLELPNSHITTFLKELNSEETMTVPDKMAKLLKAKIAGEGANLRREIILNCILPMSLCLASEKVRIGLFLWYWSTPALNSYGILNRKFKEMPQNYLWQQQGMLEYLKEYGRKPNVVAEALKDYGFAQILSFYKTATSMFEME
jgi:hypothetical protein